MKLFAACVLLVSLPVAAGADEIAVTVYNSNLGVISEVRSLEFERGVKRVAFTDVPSQIDASSVRFEVVGSTSQVNILEQNYAFDLVGPEKIYEKYVDKTIELIDKDGRLYSGTLLAYSGGAVTLKEPTGRIKIVLMNNITEANFPDLPEGLITRPTLFWLYDSAVDGQKECLVSYQTTGLTWNAEYVGILNAEETKLGLSGWASINNTSGKTYSDATLKLVAGDIHRAEPEYKRGRDMNLMAAEASSIGFEEKTFFEYHLYTLPRKATVADKENKQISLFEPATTSVKKVFVYRPDRNESKVEVALEFVNSQAAGLGLPLPAGRVRLFQADADGFLILLGEDRIDHTPQNEEVTVQVGNAFDIAAEHRLMEQTRVSQTVEDRVFEIELRNRKKEPVTVEVEKQLYGFWEVLETSHEYKKKDASTITFDIPVVADATVVVRFKVRFTQR